MQIEMLLLEEADCRRVDYCRHRHRLWDADEDASVLLMLKRMMMLHWEEDVDNY